jgi:hypothetical protein
MDNHSQADVDIMRCGCATSSEGVSGIRRDTGRGGNVKGFYDSRQPSRDNRGGGWRSFSVKEPIRRFFVMVLADELPFFLKSLEQTARVMISRCAGKARERCCLYPTKLKGVTVVGS